MYYSTTHIGALNSGSIPNAMVYEFGGALNKDRVRAQSGTTYSCDRGR
ncbi:MAG: hypothetical protein JJE04_13980 [Acidobacteriia bacterium]|nr:hypothetical protein [Terriglobia bacterium]